MVQRRGDIGAIILVGVSSAFVLQCTAVHNVLFVDYDSPVSKIAPVSATGLYM